MSGIEELRLRPPVNARDEQLEQPGLSVGESRLEDQPDNAEDFQVDEGSDSPEREPSHSSRQWGILGELSIVGHLIFFSILGTLARLGVQWLTFYPGAPVTTSVLWANVGGSYVMGFLSEDRQLFQFPAHLEKPNMSPEDRKAQHAKHKKTIPLYIGLATGFCGSFTSFSSFMRDAFLALSNDLPSPSYHPSTAGNTPAFTTTHARNNGYSVPAVLAVLLSEPALSLAALFAGAHTALLLDRQTPSIPTPLSRIIDRLATPLGLGAWLAVILIAIFPPDTLWRGSVLFALVLAPLGTLVRFYASLHLNPRFKSFPLGTFVVNILGTAVLGMSWDLQRVRLGRGGVVGGSVVACQVLQGVEDGFCGCLTTVSTWVAELQALRRGHAYRYGLGSVGAGLATMVVVMGSVRWGMGWETPVCVTGRTSS